MKSKSSVFLTICLIAISFILGCKKTKYITTTTSDVNIYAYLVKNPDKFSDLVKILDKAGFNEFLDAYGAYTLFAPDNNAIKLFLQETGKASIDAFSENELKDIVRLHLIQDTITTNSFKDGKLPQITMFGQYLLTGVTFKNNVSSYTINRIALVTEPNIKLANGNIHVIDHVLKAATLTMAKLVEQNAELSIFTQALKETGYYDSLNIVNNADTTRRFLTVLAETNKALLDSGIATYAALKARYSQTGNPKNAADSLHLYVAYHIVTDARYIADIVTTSSLPTLAPLEVLTPSLDGETVLINDLVFNGIHEPGVVIDRGISDITATNGVVHFAKAHFAIKNRLPVRVDWDVADVPEIRKLTAVFRKSTPAPGTPGGFTITSNVADITWEPTAGQRMAYGYTGTTSTSFFQWWSDFIIMPMGLTNTARAKWYEFRTPLIVKGRYKVWICYRYARQSTNNPAFPLRVLFDGEPFARTFRFEEPMPAGTPGELEAIGWKSYTADVTPASQVVNNPARLVGTVDVKTTDRHVIRFEATTGGGQSNNYLDMIQFIPINDNQLSPKFSRDGKIVP